MLFGALSRLDKRAVCATLGNPDSLTRDGHGHTIWGYDKGPRITFSGNRAVAHDAPGKAAIGG